MLDLESGSPAGKYLCFFLISLQGACQPLDSTRPLFVGEEEEKSGEEVGFYRAGIAAKALSDAAGEW